MEKNMNDFWKSYDITHAELGPNFRCYPLYGKIHLIELALSLVFIVGMALSGGASSWALPLPCWPMKLPCCWAWL